MGDKDLRSQLEGLFSDLEPIKTIELPEPSAVVAEEQLPEQVQSEEQVAIFRALAENATDAIGIGSLDGRVLYRNRACDELFGYDHEQQEMIGLDLTTFFPDEERGRLIEEILPQAMAEGQRIETAMRRKDGSCFDAFLTLFPIQDEQGQPVTMAAIIRDITERKRLEREREEVYERRVYQVQTSTEIAQEIATAPALDELFRRVVTLVKERFAYYHAQIFRYEPALDAVVLVTGYGEAGQKMLARGHHVEMGRGIVGTAVATGRPVLATDVAQEKDWEPNPDLPEIKSELAVPIKLRDQVLGILDVQSDQVGALTEDDQLLLEGLCGQIAIAMEGTRLRQEMEERLHELNSMYRAMSREGWEAFRETAELPTGYLFDHITVQPADDLWTPEMKLAVEQSALVPPATRDEAPDQTAAVAPLSVRGEIIGALGVYDDPQHPLSPDDLSLVESVSEQVALALESARLFGQTQTALSATENLYQISAGLNAARTYDDILIALRVHTVMGEAKYGGLFLFNHPWEDEMPEKVSVLAEWGSSEEMIAILRQVSLQDLPVARILRRDAPVWVEDIWKDDRFDVSARALYGALDTRAVFFVPLVTEGRWIGFLSAGWPEPTASDPASLRLLMAVAGQAAVAAQNLQRLQEIQVRAQREQTLRETVATINASEDLVAGLPAITRHLRGLVPLTSLALTTYTPGEHEYTLFAVGTETEAGSSVRHGIRLPLKGTGTGWVITHGEPWLEADIRLEKPFAEDEQLVAEGLVSRLMLPLRLGERVIGTLNLGGDMPGAFTEEHLPVLRQVADQMALVLERARLMEETRAALAEVEATYRRYLRQEWEGFLGRAASRTTGYLDGPAGLTATAEVSTPEIEQAIASGELTALTGPTDGDGPAPCAALAMPIRLRGQTIGVLDFYQEGEERTWTDEERTLVETLAVQVALTLENARLFTETREAAQRTQALYETSRTLSSALETDTIIRAILEAVYRALGCEYMTVATVDEQAGMIEDRHGIWHGEYDVFPEWTQMSRYPLDHPDIMADIYRTGRTEVIGGWDDRFNREIWDKFGHERLLRIFMPIKIRDRVIGIVEVGYDKREKDHIEPEEVQMLAAFVDQAAVALENARLLQQAQQRARHEQLAREITGRIQAAADVEAALQTVVRELGRALGTPHSFVQLGGVDQSKH